MHSDGATVRRVRGIDTDNYDGNIPVEHFDLLHRKYDVDFNIIGLERPDLPFQEQQAVNSLGAGLAIPLCYKFLYWRDSDIENMKRAAGFGFPIAVDVEFGDGMPGGPEATVERIAEAKYTLLREGLYWGQYSNKYIWDRLTGGSMAFAGDRGWAAGYPFGEGRVPPTSWLPDFDTFTRFGGTKLEIIQYADACYEDGPWHLDLNCMLVQDAEENEVIQHVTISDEERAGAPFRSYLISGSTALGFSSRWVEGADGFEAANFITEQDQVLEIPLVLLETFNPAPHPRTA